MYLRIIRNHLREKLSVSLLSKHTGLCLICACITICSLAQIKTRTGKQISTAEMDRFLREQMDSLQLPALSIAIINDGKIAYHRTLGVADINTGVRVNDQSVFEAASLSKPVFAYWVMKMAEKGKLDLDKPLYQYLPFPEISHDERYKLITARMVLNHTTGFPNWRWYDRADSALHIKDNDMYIRSSRYFWLFR